jgi:hypothetical protein
MRKASPSLGNGFLDMIPKHKQQKKNKQVGTTNQKASAQ